MLNKKITFNFADQEEEVQLEVHLKKFTFNLPTKKRRFNLPTQEEEVQLEAHPRESGCSLGNALAVCDFAHVVDPLHVLGGGVAPDVGQPLSGVAEVVLVQVVLVEALLVAVRERVDEELVVGQLL